MNRRGFLRLLGGAAVAVPVVAVLGKSVVEEPVVPLRGEDYPALAKVWEGDGNSTYSTWTVTTDMVNTTYVVGSDSVYTFDASGAFSREAMVLVDETTTA